MKQICVLAVLMVAFVIAPIWAEAPKTMSYQGVLQDGNGQAINGLRSLKFVIYAANGAPIWNETHSVTVTDGVFGVILGTQGSPLDLAFNEPYTMGISVGSDPELSPRVPLVSSPYSLNTRGISHINGDTFIGNPTRIWASSNKGSLSFGTGINSRIFGLWDDPGNWFGLGIEPSAMRFQVGSLGSRFSFYAGDNTQVMTLDGGGNLHVAGAMLINGSNMLEFGRGVVGKEVSAGQIGYQRFTPGALDIVGAGTVVANRKIRFWTEGGAFFTGAIHAPVKNFRIPHPQKAGTDLVHSSIEGPEIAVYYRGETQLVGGTVVVTLPDYFEALTQQAGRTVQLTCKNGWSPLFVDGEISGGKFTVKTTDAGDSAQAFYWEVKAVRSDVEALSVEVPSMGNP
ncbi:MAG: hypothetical protein QGG64_14180 [Candidatus Latescibacteria bacterium]|nr:hypothetical protein [Candidatus Latescibacterota bacterium]